MEKKENKKSAKEYTTAFFLLQAGYVKHRPGFAGQVQGGHPCRGSRAAEALAGRDGAKTCALVKKRAGAAEKVPQNRPNISE